MSWPTQQTYEALIYQVRFLDKADLFITDSGLTERAYNQFAANGVIKKRNIALLPIQQ